MSEQPHIYLLTGSNIGNRMGMLCKAIQLISSAGYNIVQQSAVYETAAWGMEDQQPFLNQCLVVSKQVSPQQLMQEMKKIEILAGRKRMEKWGPRTLDIDILLFENLIVNDADLIIPHPYLPQRRFALLPLAMLASTRVHPVLHVPISTLLDNCADSLAVNEVAQEPCKQAALELERA